MSDIEISTGSAIWSGVLTFGLAIMGYFFRKRDAKIDAHDTAITQGERDRSALELKMAENYATKSSLTLLFQESQRANKESSDRLEKRVDETKTEIGKTNDKIDRIGDKILSELSKKT